ncbi:MAG: hypothetical protein FJW23_07690 [Acidimicrobiia bacterium]|nr:hypothetical protein [Acidimicrobiia bacterium]
MTRSGLLRAAAFCATAAVVLAGADTALAQVVACTPHSYPQRTDQSLAVDPFDDRIVYVGVEGEGYFKTTDDGRTWSRIVEGIRAFQKIGGGLCYSEFFDTVIDPRNPEHVCMAMAGSPGTLDVIQAQNQGVYCSTDGGLRWEQRVGAGMNTAIYALAIDPTDSQTIYAGSNANPASYQGANPDQLFNTVGVVHKSTDGGLTWTELPTGLVKGTRVTGLDIDPDVPTTIYASTFGLLSGGGSNYLDRQFGVLKSTDGGATWTSMKTGLGPELRHQAIFRMELSPRASGRLIVSVGDTSYFLSSDGAASFVRPSAPTSQAGIMTFDPTDPAGLRLVGLSQTGTQLVESLDGGSTWRAIGTLPPDTLNNGDPSRPTGVRPSDVAISHQNHRIMYLAGSHASVYRTTDGGATWTKVLSADMLPAIGAPPTAPSAPSVTEPPPPAATPEVPAATPPPAGEPVYGY